MIKIEFPLDWRLSKNELYRNRYIPKTSQKLLDDIKILIETEAKKEKWEKKKTYIDIVVHKRRGKENKGDIVNLVDGICDAVKRGIHIDDYWFAGSFDWFWSRNGKSNVIEISVSQDDRCEFKKENYAQ